MIAVIEKFQKVEDLLMFQIHQIFNTEKRKNFLTLQKFFIFITKLGDGFLYPIIFSIILLFSNFQIGFFFSFISSFIVERVMYYLIKNLTRRIRPFEKLKFQNIPILPPDKYSFPSGHTSAAFLFATLISLYFPMLTLFVFIFAFLVGISRIVLNLHYPTDVFIGSQLGISIAIITNEIIKILLI